MQNISKNRNTTIHLKCLIDKSMSGNVSACYQKVNKAIVYIKNVRCKCRALIRCNNKEKK